MPRNSKNIIKNPYLKTLLHPDFAQINLTSEVISSNAPVVNVFNVQEGNHAVIDTPNITDAIAAQVHFYRKYIVEGFIVDGFPIQLLTTNKSIWIDKEGNQSIIQITKAEAEKTNDTPNNKATIEFYVVLDDVLSVQNFVKSDYVLTEYGASSLYRLNIKATKSKTSEAVGEFDGLGGTLKIPTNDILNTFDAGDTLTVDSDVAGKASKPCTVLSKDSDYLTVYATDGSEIYTYDEGMVFLTFTERTFLTFYTKIIPKLNNFEESKNENKSEGIEIVTDKIDFKQLEVIFYLSLSDSQKLQDYFQSYSNELIAPDGTVYTNLTNSEIDVIDDNKDLKDLKGLKVLINYSKSIK